MKKTLVALALAIGAGAALAEEQAVTVVLSDASPMTQGMAMVLANQMQEQGAQVDILLCDEAGNLALKDIGGQPLEPNKVTPAQLLDGAVKKGARAAVCALYLPNSGKKAEDLKEGIKPAKPAEMARLMMEPGRRVIGF